jgi:hypothetical protein
MSKLTCAMKIGDTVGHITSCSIKKNFEIRLFVRLVETKSKIAEGHHGI